MSRMKKKCMLKYYEETAILFVENNIVRESEPVYRDSGKTIIGKK